MDAKYARFLTVQVGEEAIDQPIYSIQSYPAAGQVQFNFFNTAVGASANTFGDTNLPVANQLNAGQRYLVRSISVFFMAGIAPQKYTAGANPQTQLATESYINDVQAALEQAAYLEVDLGVKPYIQTGPLTYYPAGFGLYIPSAMVQGFQAVAADAMAISGHAINGMPTKGALHQLSVPLVIPPLYQFTAKIVYPAAKALPSGTAGRIGVVFNGLLIRPVQ
jgi:hypothetical protein